MDELQKLEKWLDGAINQNIGVFYLHGDKCACTYAKKSLGILSYENPFRKWTVWFIHWKVFEIVVIAFIVVGSFC